MTQPPETSKNGPALTRRRFLGLTAAGAASVVGVGTYARAFEPGWFEVKKVVLPQEKFPAQSGLKILHLSDLHWSEAVPLEMLEHAFRLGLAEEPDLICLTGDFVTRGHFPDSPKKLSRLLRLLSNAAPTFACQGNHDVPLEPIKAMLTEGGVHLLENETTHAVLEGKGKVRITGLGDMAVGFPDPTVCLSEKGIGVSPGTPHILLCHTPDGKEFARDFSWHLMLSGHTHGGQVCVPFFGAVVIPLYDKRFVAGLYRWDGRLIYVTRGVGNLHGIRFCCRPEITLLTV